MAGRKITFEVLTLQNGRWSMHGRYDNQERAMAMSEAEKLEKQKSIKTVKVVKETYDPESDSSSEVTVYQSAGSGTGAGAGSKRGGASPPAKKTKKTTKTAPKGAPQAQAPAEDQPQAGEAGKKNHKTSGFGLIGKIAIIILVAAIAGTFLSSMISFVVRNTKLLEGVIQRSELGTLLFVVFVLAFLLTGIVLALIFLNKDDLSAAPDLPHVGSGAGNQNQGQARSQNKNPYTQDKGDSFYGEDGEDDGLEEEDDEGTVYADDIEEDAFDRDAEAESIRQAVKKESEQVKNLRNNLVAFLEEGIGEIKAANVRLDKFNLFGLSLFLAGACDAFGIEEGLNNNERNEVLAELVVLLGISKPQADKFVKIYDSYLATDSRYLNMFKSGIDAMRSRIRSTEESSVGLQMKNALNEWNKPKPKDPDTGPITVMFTDMVGSTALNQEKGDKVAQEVVRQHNRIVRTNLTVYNGKEIKHTGDGIMASFSVSSSGVEAAAEIQKQIMAETRADEEVLLKIRIGLHAGELIVEDNDLFGTTVQLAARICDRADTGEVFVSETIRSICAGTAELDFFDEGKYELKGIDKPMTLYSIIYDEHAEERRDARHAKEGDEVGGKGKRITESEEGDDEDSDQINDLAPDENNEEETDTIDSENELPGLETDDKKK